LQGTDRSILREVCGATALALLLSGEGSDVQIPEPKWGARGIYYEFPSHMMDESRGQFEKYNFCLFVKLFEGFMLNLQDGTLIFNLL
jgi:hypothetical protein